MRGLRARWLAVLLAALLWVAAGCRSAATEASSGPTTQPADSAASGRAETREAPAAADRPAASAPPTTAPDLSAELGELRTRWLKDLGRGHSAAVQSPFLVVINGPGRLAERWMSRTVVPATRRIQSQFMKVHPDKPLVVLLFANQDSYRSACKRVLHVNSPPYFGFYRPWQRLLVMDISTGGGTLVHELTHAMIAFDFPEIPDWFNEALGSLYEQCRFDGDRLVGLVNWRLPALQKAIKDKRLGTLAELTRKNFHGPDMGLNYAQARYLAFYMQQHDCLETYYRAFRDGRKEDPTGLRFLRKAFEPRSLEQVDADLRKWVMALRWPPR